LVTEIYHFLTGTDVNPDYTQLMQSFPSERSQRIAFYDLEIYGQHEWHARPALTLTLALRAEHPSNPVCQRRCFARLSGAFQSASHDPNQPYNQAILIDQKQAFESINQIVSPVIPNNDSVDSVRARNVSSDDKFLSTVQPILGPRAAAATSIWNGINRLELVAPWCDPGPRTSDTATP
jgi:hypothetical protein